jgi:hypothetical protein
LILGVGRGTVAAALFSSSVGLRAGIAVRSSAAVSFAALSRAFRAPCSIPVTAAYWPSR